MMGDLDKLVASIGVLLVGCGSTAPSPALDPGPPECGTFVQGRVATLIPGPGQEGFDEALAAKAHTFDRIFHAISARGTGLNTEFNIGYVPAESPLTAEERRSLAASRREMIEQFAVDEQSWDFEAAMGVAPDSIGAWQKSTGIYSGAGIVADAFRYAALRDAGEACDEVERARVYLVEGMETMDLVSRINGVPGVTARSVVRTDRPFQGAREPTPLFDENGEPLPTIKNNGEWREDRTGAYSTWLWEDSISRDMLVGWALGYGGVWEVVRDDPTIDGDLKTRLRENARATALALTRVGESGFDLEIPDADGRLTLHAYLNENVVDRLYVPGADNGFHAIMALGIVGAFAYVADDPELDTYLKEQLIESRELPSIAAEDMLVVNNGVGSNFSNFNMAFTGLWLAQRYIGLSGLSGFMKVALLEELYQKPGRTERQPKDMGQTYFDFIYAAAMIDSKPDGSYVDGLDRAAINRGIETLEGFPSAPFFDDRVENCDATEIEAERCQLDDGSSVTVLGEVGWKGSLVVRDVVPMRIRPPSNYHWRSNPYQPNGGSETGTLLLGAPDFRVAYWMGRRIVVGDAAPIGMTTR